VARSLLPSLLPPLPPYQGKKDEGTGEAVHVVADGVVRRDIFALREVMELVKGEKEA